MVVVAIIGVKLNVGKVIIYERKHFSYRKDMFLPSLITELCRRTEVPLEPTDVWALCDKPFDPLAVKGGPERSGKVVKKRKSRGEGEASGNQDSVGADADPAQEFGGMERVEHNLRVVKDHLMAPSRSGLAFSACKRCIPSLPRLM